MKPKMNLLQRLGILLIVCSLGILLLSRFYFRHTQTRSTQITRTIQALLPEATPGFAGEYPDPVMPVLQISEKDYVCILEIPAHGFTQAVANEWDQMTLFTCPARFYGSAYDGTMIIGGTDQMGQFDFFDRMDQGDTVRVLDMVGTAFTYTVQRIDRARSVSYETLSAGEYPLTLFVRGAYSSEYILVRCGVE